MLIPVGDVLRVELFSGDKAAAGYLADVWQETSYQLDTQVFPFGVRTGMTKSHEL